MNVVFISGPYRSASGYVAGRQDAFGIASNVHRAMALALDVWRLGAVALCPHANTADLDGSAPDELWLAGDLELLRRCDAVIMTPDWETSSGARAEHTFAETHGLPIFYDLAALEGWLRQTPLPRTA